MIVVLNIYLISLEQSHKVHLSSENGKFVTDLVCVSFDTLSSFNRVFKNLHSCGVRIRKT